MEKYSPLLYSTAEVRKLIRKYLIEKNPKTNDGTTPNQLLIKRYLWGSISFAMAVFIVILWISCVIFVGIFILLSLINFLFYTLSFISHLLNYIGLLQYTMTMHHSGDQVSMPCPRLCERHWWGIRIESNVNEVCFVV